jgi:hypothetical protein
MRTRKFLLIISLLITCAQFAKTERIISIDEIIQMYNSADLVILCTVKHEKEIFISNYDSLYSDGYHHLCTYVKLRYFINVDSIAKGNIVNQMIDSVETPVIDKGRSMQKEEFPKFEGFDTKGDSLMSIGVSVMPEMGTSWSWLKLEAKSANWVFLKKVEKGYEIIYAYPKVDFLNDMKLQIGQKTMK